VGKGVGWAEGVRREGEKREGMGEGGLAWRREGREREQMGRKWKGKRKKLCGSHLIVVGI